MPQFHDFPALYLKYVRSAMPLYDRLQDEVVRASGTGAKRILDLGVGTGETAHRCLTRHQGASVVGLDVSAPMLEVARSLLPRADLRAGDIAGELPEGPFDLIVSALAVHHVTDKPALFARIAQLLPQGGRFVLADVVLADVSVTPLDPDIDHPETVADQVAWLTAAGLRPSVVWAEQDLAVISSER